MSVWLCCGRKLWTGVNVSSSAVWTKKLSSVSESISVFTCSMSLIETHTNYKATEEDRDRKQLQRDTQRDPKRQKPKVTTKRLLRDAQWRWRDPQKSRDAKRLQRDTWLKRQIPTTTKRHTVTTKKPNKVDTKLVQRELQNTWRQKPKTATNKVPNVLRSFEKGGNNACRIILIGSSQFIFK